MDFEFPPRIVVKSVRELPAPWAAPVNCGQPVAGSYDGRAIIMDSWRTERRGDVMEHFSGLILCVEPRAAHPQLSPNLGKSSFIQAPPAPQTNGLYTLALGVSKSTALLRGLILCGSKPPSKQLSLPPNDSHYSSKPYLRPTVHILG